MESYTVCPVPSVLSLSMALKFPGAALSPLTPSRWSLTGVFSLEKHLLVLVSSLAFTPTVLKWPHVLVS